MRPISSKPLFTLSFFVANSSSRTFRISNFSTSVQFHSHSSPTSTTSYPSRRHEEESRNVRVSVWWDFENCHLPTTVNVFRVAQCITNAVRANGIKGPIQITAFGDVMQLSRTNQEALSATGINLAHVPSGGKNSADRSLLVDLMYWVSQNPPPAHLFLISGDRDFSGILHRLRMNNYNILLACPNYVPSVLCSAASIMWQWNALLRGENLMGKHFNQPPDGPYASWYGHYKAPLEDPFTVSEQKMCARADESSESAPESKRPIPRAVMRQIRQIVNSYPKGIPITDLRVELGKSNVIIDKDLYGYKKFSKFLLAMPHILKLQSGNDGQFLVKSINPRVSEQKELSPDTYTGALNSTGESEIVTVPQPDGEGASFSDVVFDKSPVAPYTETRDRANSLRLQETVNVQEVEVQEPLKKFEAPSLSFGTMDNAKEDKSHLHDTEEQRSPAEMGIFQILWRKCFRSRDGFSDQQNFSNETKLSSGEKIVEDIDIEFPKNQSATEPVVPALFSPSSHEAMIDGKTTMASDVIINKSTPSSILNKIRSWSKLWSVPAETKHSLFANESFWKEMEAFVDTALGWALILQSRSRVDLAQNLQKRGPSVLRSLNGDDLLHLVDLLIVDKKWVEEFQSQSAPFRVIRSSRKEQSESHPLSSNGLSSIFLGKEPSSITQNLQEPGEMKLQNLPHTGVSPAVGQRDSTGKSRTEVLADCQKVVELILKKHPEGFNMGSFRKLFYEQYGYYLDLQKLGYTKLVSLLQIMPGVRIESNYIFPAEILKSPGLQASDFQVQGGNSDGELSDSSKKDSDLDSPWEELGPVANGGHKKDNLDSGFTEKTRDIIEGQTDHDYEPLGNSDFSDSEEETSPKSETEDKSRMHEKDSALLQILDSWYSSKEDNDKKDAPKNLSKEVDASGNGWNQSTQAQASTITKTLMEPHARRQKSTKSYSFVSEPGDSKDDRLIDGILGTLKKSSERSLESRMPN